MQRVVIVLSVISIVLSIVALVIANRNNKAHHNHHDNLSSALVPLSPMDKVVYADGVAPVVSTGVSGWAFTNTIASQISNKINWYFYNAKTALNNITLGAVASSNDLGYWAVIVPGVTATSVTQFPVLAIYTYPSAGQSGWYTSKVTFDSTGSTLNKYAANSPVLIYTGKDNNTHFPAIPGTQRLKYTYNSAASVPANNPKQPDPSQQILVATLATYSGTVAAGAYNFSAMYLGLTSKAFNPTYLLMNS